MVLAPWDRAKLAEDSCVEDAPGWGGVTLALNLASREEVDAATEETYAVSVFAVRQLSLDELAQQPPLVRFGQLTLITAGAIRAAGLTLEPTGRNRLHYGLRFDDLGGIERLCDCEHRVWVNPYYEA